MTTYDLALLAGGKASRLGKLAENKPKSLLEVAGHPFLYHQLHWLKSQGIQRVVICCGHLGEMIQSFAGDGSDYGLEIRYSFDGPNLLGTGGALKKALPLLSDPFFVLFGDSFLQLNFSAMSAAFEKAESPAMMSLYRNAGALAPSNVEFRGGQILDYDKKKLRPEMQHIDYGVEILSKGCFALEDADSFDLGELQQKLVSEAKLSAFEVQERFYEIGSPEALKEAEAFIRSKAS